MASTSEIIHANPIGTGLDSFRILFTSTCEANSIPITADALGELERQDAQGLASNLLSTLQLHPVSRRLPSKTGYGMLHKDLVTLNTAINSQNLPLDHIKPLLSAVLEHTPDNDIWYQVHNVVAKASLPATPPPRTPIHPSVSRLKEDSKQMQTPVKTNSGSIVNSNEYTKNLDQVIKDELGVMYANTPGFHERFFGCMAHLKYKEVFNKCKDKALFSEGDGWAGWPQVPEEEKVIPWFRGITEELIKLVQELNPTAILNQQPVGHPTKPLRSNTQAKRKLDVGFVKNPNIQGAEYHWSRILVPGELKKNAESDIPSDAQVGLGKYVREVMSSQPTRRFVLSFTLCGSAMRVWEFDRVGAIGSEQFDINQDAGAELFVLTVLGFLYMNREQLGFDPTFREEERKSFIEIQKNGNTERLNIEGLIMHSYCIVGRATTCWKACTESNRTVVIKDSWQYTERPDEGELLQEVTEKGVVNMARYYHHETVRICGEVDQVQENIRRGLNIAVAEPVGGVSEVCSPSPSASGTSKQQQGKKRTSSEANAAESASKRGRLNPPSNAQSKAGSKARSGASLKSRDTPPANRVHRRLVIDDYGVPISEARSPSALLAALDACIAGHQSLHENGILHRDISINNILINENDNERPAFLIDLDLAIRESRVEGSVAQGRTGTKAFMAIGVLRGEPHSFRHDLESFFWVLFWICIHYDGPRKGTVVERFEKWNYQDMEDLAGLKRYIIGHKKDFARTMDTYCQPYFESVAPWLEKLRKVVFPGGVEYQSDNERLYSQMRDVLQKGSKALANSAEEIQVP
ncbi:G protein-coupled receptor kinase 2 [Cytospora mali]|uniref:non-specific serine/threonine protein kinase n=1 Tax=Cytospora mali TaxID=578113 RepID=A0A194W459_CYTMA|nr:G protein-coupled receptor kinase 2 [Valsa mali]